MLAWAQARLRARWPNEHGRATTLVHERDQSLAGLLASHGYQRGGEWLYMQRPLDASLAPASPPHGFTVRSVGGLDEAEPRAAVLGQAFEALPFVEWYRKLMQAPGYQPELDLVAVAPDGQFGAFALGWLDTGSQVGQFEPVGTAPTFRRMGLARTLLLEGLWRMRKRGAASAFVIVEAAELAACHLYASVGLKETWRLHMYQERFALADVQ
jgi:ribosomal protein S18 acetylase RimI-like enzyme